MSVYDFIELLADDNCNLVIYDLTTDEEIFNGPARDATFENVADLEISSIDAPERTWSFTINVATEDLYDGDIEDEF